MQDASTRGSLATQTAGTKSAIQVLVRKAWIWLGRRRMIRTVEAHYRTAHVNTRTDILMASLTLLGCTPSVFMAALFVIAGDIEIGSVMVVLLLGAGVFAAHSLRLAAREQRKAREQRSQLAPTGSRYIRSTSGAYVAFIQHGHLFDTDGRWLGIIERSTEFYDQDGKFRGRLRDDNRIMSDASELPRPSRLPPWPPDPPRIPPSPLIHLPMRPLKDPYEDIFDESAQTLCAWRGSERQ